MRTIKKVIAFAIVLAMTLTMFSISVESESIEETAVPMVSGKKYSLNMPLDNDYADYKLSVTSAGTLSVDISSCMSRSMIQLFDSNGNTVPVSKIKTTSGGDDYAIDDTAALWWNDTIEKYTGTISWSVKKGTYYLRYQRGTYLYLASGKVKGDGEVTLSATFPSSKTGKIVYLSLTISKGSRIKLGSVLSGGLGTVKWKSSKKSVATVSSSGTVTAKANGSTIITAKCGSSSKKIKIIVTE